MGEAGVEEGVGGLVSGDFLVFPAGKLGDGGEVGVEALAAGDFGGEAAILRERPQLSQQILAAADQGIAGAVGGAGVFHDAPGGPFGDGEGFFEGAAVDPVLGQGIEGGDGVGEAVEVEGHGRHKS